MVSKDTLLEVLPVRNQVVLTEDRQNTTDIQNLIIQKHKFYEKDYDLISHYFDTGDIVDTSRQIFDFLKTNVPYTKENGKYQTVKSPALILSSNDGNGNFDRVDCKNYASFIGGVIDSIKRNGGDSDYNWDWAYRFASYDANDPEPGHVFVVVKIDGKELWIDPVFTYFNGGDLTAWQMDKKPTTRTIGGLYSISGAAQTGTVTVNTKDAAQNFLVALQLNLYGLADLLLAHPQITTSKAFLKTLSDCGVNLISFFAILKSQE
jgi:hypothetical protein